MRIVNAVCLAGFVVTFFVMLFAVTYWRITNIDMTETRLFFTYFREIIGISLLFIVFAAGYEFTKK